MMDRLTLLREENDELRERVRQLEALLTPEGIVPPKGCYLTPTELRIFRHLSSGRVASVDAVLSIMALFSGRDLGPNSASVYICKLRKKLHPHGIAIRSHWGAGWQLIAPEAGVA